MGVQFDWQIDEIEAGEEHDAPPPGRPAPRAASPAPRRLWRPTRSWWLFTAVAATVVLSAGVWLVGRARANQAQAEQDISNAVALEAQAFRTNDQELCVALQAQDDPVWLRRQTDWCAERGAWPSDVPYPYTVQVVSVDLHGQVAWVVIEETRPEHDGGWYQNRNPRPAAVVVPTARYRRTVFYRYAPSGWQHIAPPQDTLFWGRTLTQTLGPITVTFPESEAQAVQGRLAALVPLAERVCGDLGCPDGTRWHFTYSPDANTPVATGELALMLPPPSSAGQRVDGGLDDDGEASFVVYSAVNHAGGRRAFAFDGRHANPTYYTVAQAILNWELPSGVNYVRVVLHLDDTLQRLFVPDASGGDPNIIPLPQLGTQTEFGPGYPIGHVQGAGLSAFVAQAQAYSLVDYVAQVYGRDKVGTLLRAARDAQSVGAALQSALGLKDLQDFQRGWLAFGRAAYGQPR